MMWHTITRIWDVFDTPARRQIAFVFFIMIVGSALEVLGIGLIFPILKIVSDPEGSLQSSELLSKLYAGFGFSQIKVFLIVLCAFTFAVFVVKNFFTFFTAYIQCKFVWEQRTILSNSLFGKYLNAPHSFYLVRDTATLLRNVTQTVYDFYGGVLMPLLLISTELLVIIALLLFLLWIEPEITLIACLLLGLAALAFYFGIRGHLARWGRQVQDSNRERLEAASQTFAGIKEIKSMTREFYFQQWFLESTRKNARARMLFAVLNQVPRASLEILAIGVILATLIVILLEDRDLDELLPTLGVFSLSVARILPSMNRISGQFNALRFGTAALDVLHDDIVSLEEGDFRERPNSQHMEFAGNLSLSDVGFQYVGAQAAALSDIDLSIRKGESIAFVGPSGAGKTTLADIIMGLLQPTTGRVAADGILISTNIRGWRAKLGYIPQELFLINDTLRRNIALGVNDRAIDEARISAAIKSARLEEFIHSLADGLDTQVGDRGIRLSGGQRQRIAIARALYHDPDILVMDEATSSLDSEMEMQIGVSIDQLSGTKTLIIVAHRLSTVKHCDRIVLLEDGRITGIGSFEQLSAENAKFQKMVEAAQLERNDML